MRIVPNLIAILATLSTAPAFASTTGLDTRFGTGGMVLLGPTPISAQKMGLISSVATQTDGKVLIAGRVTDPSGPGMGSFLPAVGRLNVDGSWDATFADHGLLVLPFATASAPYGGNLRTIGRMSDGSILASGGAYSAQFGSNFSSCTLLLKLTSAGVLDATFGSAHSGSFCYDFAGAASTWFLHYDGIAIDSDDTWYLTSPYTNFSYGAVAHFDAVGALIGSYGNGGVAALPSGVRTSLVAIQPDHALLVTGAHFAASTQSIAVVRLNTTGAVDTQYGTAGVFTIDPQTSGDVVSPLSIALDGQGRLLVSDDDSGGPYRFARVTPSGATDSTFNGAGQQPGYPGFAMPVVSGNNLGTDTLIAAQPLADGHIFAIGDAGPVAASDGASNIALLRLNEDSSYDRGFGDAAHPGWASLHIGVSGTSNTYANALAFDNNTRAVIAIGGTDINNNVCSGIIRAIPDRLFADNNDPALPAPTCPQ